MNDHHHGRLPCRARTCFFVFSPQNIRERHTRFPQNIRERRTHFPQNIRDRQAEVRGLPSEYTGAFPQNIRALFRGIGPPGMAFPSEHTGVSGRSSGVSLGTYGKQSVDPKSLACTGFMGVFPHKIREGRFAFPSETTGACSGPCEVHPRTRGLLQHLRNWRPWPA